MAKKQKTAFRGKLTEPLSLLPEAGHPAGESAPAIADLRKSEVAERLLLLLRHYGIDLSDPDHWYKLALCLACHHVPGLKVEQRGSEKDWGLQMEKKLYTDVTRFINGQKHTARSACHHLAKKRPYESIPAKSDKARGNSLYRRYMRSRDFFDRLSRMDEEAIAAHHRPLPLVAIYPDSIFAPPSAEKADQIIGLLADEVISEDETQALAALARLLPD